MPLLPQSNGLLFLLGGASVVAYLAYEYKEKIQMNKKFKEALAEIQSSEITTQTIGVESLVGYVSANKALIKDLCEHSDIFGELPQLIFSEDEEAQFAVLELMSIVSEDVQGLEAIKNSGLYSALLSFMAFPFSDQDAIRCALLTIRNSLSLSLSLSLSSPSPSSSSPSPSSPSPSLSGSGGMVHKDVRISPRGEVSGNDDYEKEEEWFARALYTQHGLEPVVNKLLLDDPDLQSLSLEIIIHYCRTLKNQDEIGELGGIGFMLEIFTSSLSSSHLKSLALSAIRYCVQTCTCNIEQFRKAGGIKAIVTYFKNNAPQPLQGSDVETQDDVFNALKILNTTIDTSGIETIRTDNIIPQLVGYFMQDCNQDIKNTTVTFLKQLAHSDPKCRREISDAFKRENRMGNAGVPPKQ